MSWVPSSHPQRKRIRQNRLSVPRTLAAVGVATVVAFAAAAVALCVEFKRLLDGVTWRP